MRWFALALMICCATTARAQGVDIVTTGSLLAGCQYLIEDSTNGDLMKMGACAGAVAAAMEIGRSQGRACPPAGTSIVQAAQVVKNFAQEGHRSQPFGPVAMTAMADRWPCR